MSWYRLFTFSSLSILALWASACGPNCQSTCNRLYTTADNGCGIERPGVDQSELISTCMDECEDALKLAGDLDGYDPFERTGSSTSVQIENEKQAALWMDCIAETSCEYLESGYCAPIW